MRNPALCTSPSIVMKHPHKYSTSIQKKIWKFDYNKFLGALVHKVLAINPETIVLHFWFENICNSPALGGSLHPLVNTVKNVKRGMHSPT